MSNIDLSKPQRQSEKGLILFFLISTRHFIRALWPLIILYIIQNNQIDGNQKSIILFGLILLLLLIVAHSILSYLNFYFYIGNNEFVVKKGYLKRVKLSIPLDRIQTINTRQNLLQQVLNVVTLEIDTAGSALKELKIIAISKENAEYLQDLLSQTEITDGIVENLQEQKTLKEKKTIVSLGNMDLLKVGISENHLKSLLLIYLFLYGIYEQLNDIFKSYFDSYSDEAKGVLLNSGIGLIIFLVVVIIFITLAYSIIRTILKYYNLVLYRQDDEFILKTGLINRKVLIIPYTKIQVLSWTTNPIRKALRFVSMKITQASSREINKKQEIVVPGCSDKNRVITLNEIFPVTDVKEWTRHHVHKIYIMRLWLLWGWAVCIPALIFLPAIWQMYALIIVWLFFSGFLSYLSYKKRFFKINENLIEVSRGSVAQEFAQMFNYKIQAIKYRQTFFQRRRNLATVDIFTAGGKTVSIPYINETLARELYNYMLYCTESTNRDWM